jgi:hypothetical protein
VQQKKQYRLDSQYTNRVASHTLADDVEMAPVLPYTLNQWKHVLGFNANTVNYKQYRVLSWAWTQIGSEFSSAAPCWSGSRSRRCWPRS